MENNVNVCTPCILSDWPNQVIFNCYMCGEEIESINDSLDHARDFHPDTYNVGKPASCSVCPKTFSKIDQLYQHIWRHLNQMYPDQIPETMIDSDVLGHRKRKKRVKSDQVSFMCPISLSINID